MAEAAENILQCSMKGSDFYHFLSNQWELQRFINIYYNIDNYFYNCERKDKGKEKKIDMSQCLEENFKVILNLAVYTILYMLGSK